MTPSILALAASALLYASGVLTAPAVAPAIEIPPTHPADRTWEKDLPVQTTVSMTSTVATPATTSATKHLQPTPLLRTRPDWLYVPNLWKFLQHHTQDSTESMITTHLDISRPTEKAKSSATKSESAANQATQIDYATSVAVHTTPLPETSSMRLEELLSYAPGPISAAVHATPLPKTSSIRLNWLNHAYEHTKEATTLEKRDDVPTTTPTMLPAEGKAVDKNRMSEYARTHYKAATSTQVGIATPIPTNLIEQIKQQIGGLADSHSVSATSSNTTVVTSIPEDQSDPFEMIQSRAKNRFSRLSLTRTKSATIGPLTVKTKTKSASTTATATSTKEKVVLLEFTAPGPVETQLALPSKKVELLSL